ncbi:MAG: acetyl ornithine aminotransferase family protein [Thermoplasmatales archaeon]|nr:acetyl ornithine aminotransferase family protein [Thermoplasmatales archaeon]MCW6171123.1 acetyl ornithine aminotransferase family protein [Thermoplasmatales archaeon]
MMENTNYEKLEKIDMKVTPPGPKAKQVIEDDKKFLATTTKSLPIVCDTASGSFVKDVDGNVYLDFAMGISVTNVGHVNPEVLKSVEEQLHKFWHFAGTDFYYPQQVEAAKAISSVTPGKFQKKVFFTNSGTESNEAAIKFVKTYTKKQEFIGFIGGFHGRTTGSLSFTSSKAIQQKGFFPALPGVFHAPYPDPYRNPFGIDGYEEPDELEDRVMDFIEKFMIKTFIPPANLAGFLVEPIQGEGGYIVPPKNFHKKLRKLADENNAVVIMDEVQTGFGRTGKFFASEHFGVEPEVISLAKSIASGIPMGAVVVKDKLDFPESGLHSNTFGGNPIASVASIATIKYIQENNLLKNATVQGEYLRMRLRELMDKYTSIGDVRGLGLMVGVDFVKDRKTKEPDAKFRNSVLLKSLENGLILLSTGSSSIRIIPALNVTEAQIDMGMEAFEKAIKTSI